MKKKNSKDIFIVALLLLTAGFLRFYNLGYSNYTADEYGAMIWVKSTESNFPDDKMEFLLTRKKGPMQYLVSYLPIFLTGEFNNEIAVRSPFALASVLAVVTFYFLIKRLTRNRLVGFISAVLLMTSGFVAAFGRIAQYQNLNLLFSFFGLYFYSHLLTDLKNLKQKSLIGTFFIGLSALSHWDVIYVIPPALLIFYQFLKRTEVPRKEKQRLFKYNVALIFLITLPFLIPYFSNFFQGGANQDYINRRFGYYGFSNIDEYIFDIKFYNPFVTVPLYLVGGLFGALLIRKSKFFVIWFLTNFAFFEFFVRKPGTHIYNFLIPLFVLVAIFLTWLIQETFEYLRFGPALFTILVLSFLYYQTFIIFVDHTVEYPWKQEDFFGHKTQKYDNEHRTRYLIGFPHNRYWKEINEFITGQNKLNGETFGYMTNESKTISEYYMDVSYKTSGDFYAVGIKDPWSFSRDYKFPQIRNKHTVKKIENELGQNVVQIYKVESN